MLRILLADDHSVVRQGIKQILTGAYNQAKFGEAGNAHELRELIGSENWDIVVLDLAMPEGNGLEILKQIKHDYPKMPVLILSMFPEDQYALRTIKAGAAGYLNKESAPEELISAIRKVATGRRYISSKLADEMDAELEARIAEELKRYARTVDPLIEQGLSPMGMKAWEWLKKIKERRA